MMSILKKPYNNLNLGRDIFNPTFGKKQYAFIFSSNGKEYGLLNNKTQYLIKNIRSEYDSFSIDSYKKNNVDSTLVDVLEAIYETSKYLRYQKHKK